MRLFVAVDVGSDVRRSVSQMIDELKRHLEHSAPRARVAWVRPDQLHLTVRFIGQVDPALGDKIRAALVHPLRTPAFDLTIARTGTFPPEGQPRVIWAGITAGIDSLRQVEQEVRSRLDGLAPSTDARDDRPHLTLGRVKNPAGLRSAALLKGRESAAFGTVRVAAVTLFESRLSSSGPTYIALARTDLAHV